LVETGNNIHIQQFINAMMIIVTGKVRWGAKYPDAFKMYALN